MSHSQAHISAQIMAAYRWWQDAGVDLDFNDDVTDWLAKPAELQPQAGPSTQKLTAPVKGVKTQQKKPDLLGDNPPENLADFHQWWLNDPVLDKIGPRGRIAPEGDVEAQLMVLVICPEQSDRQSLLSGPQGRLLDGFLRASGQSRQDIYLAAALPRHQPLVDEKQLIADGYADVLRHHIKLANPTRLLVMGRRILPLLGHEMAQETAHLQNIHHENHKLPLLAVEGLDSMLAMPRLKAKFWRKWLDWTDG